MTGSGWRDRRPGGARFAYAGRLVLRAPMTYARAAVAAYARRAERVPRGDGRARLRRHGRHLHSAVAARLGRGPHAQRRAPGRGGGGPPAGERTALPTTRSSRPV